MAVEERTSSRGGSQNQHDCWGWLSGLAATGSWRGGGSCIHGLLLQFFISIISRLSSFINAAGENIRGTGVVQAQGNLVLARGRGAVVGEMKMVR